jgi:hypothetical protein
MKRVHIAALLIVLALCALGLSLVLRESDVSAPIPATNRSDAQLQTSNSRKDTEESSIATSPPPHASSQTDDLRSHFAGAVFLDTDPSLITGADLNDILTAKPHTEYRVVKVNSDFLREQIRNIDAATPISLDLVEGPIDVIPESGEEVTDGWRNGFATLRGRIEGADQSKVSLGISPGGLVTGHFQSNDIGYVAIEPIGDGGEHLLWKMRDDVEKEID